MKPEKLSLVFFMFLFLLTSLKTKAQQGNTMEDNLIVELNSKYTFSETIERITVEAKAGLWNMPAVHDLQRSLANSGKDVKPVSVIEICKPEYSGKLLELKDERIFSVFMPCRISVYEKDDGKTFVSIMNGEALAKDQPANIADVMKTASAEILNIVKKATQ